MNSAIYGVVLSIIICMIAVMLFTGHVLLLLIIFVCIAGKLPHLGGSRWGIMISE